MAVAKEARGKVGHTHFEQPKLKESERQQGNLRAPALRSRALCAEKGGCIMINWLKIVLQALLVVLEIIRISRSK
jgi:hypothetical protein